MVLLQTHYMRQPLKEYRMVKGHPDYIVSCDGEVFSFKSMRMLSPYKNKKTRYLSVHISGKQQYTHRITLTAFTPNPLTKPACDHINGMRDDNRIENLRWVTIKENANNPNNKKTGWKKGNKPWNTGVKNPFSPETIKRMRESHLGQKPTTEQLKKIREKMINHPKFSKIVYQYSMDGKFLNKFSSAHEAARFLNKNDAFSNIAWACRRLKKGIVNGYLGFLWSYTPITNM